MQQAEAGEVPWAGSTKAPVPPEGNADSSACADAGNKASIGSAESLRSTRKRTTGAVLGLG